MSRPPSGGCGAQGGSKEARSEARLLNVSTPYAIKMLDEGEIPLRKVGTHRRARLADVLAYRDQQYEARKAVLDDQMAAVDQELGLT